MQKVSNGTYNGLHSPIVNKWKFPVAFCSRKCGQQLALNVLQPNRLFVCIVNVCHQVNVSCCSTRKVLRAEWRDAATEGIVSYLASWTRPYIDAYKKSK